MPNAKTRFVLVALLGAFLVPSHAEWRYLETANLRVIYSAPYLNDLAPYATRCLMNSLAGQEARFGYTPDDKVTVWLLDRTDYGRAAASVLPWDRLTFDVAPKNTAFETFSAGERICTWANHELVHIANMDQAAPEDVRFRRLFGGKVLPVSEHPESILYSYLTNPRFASPAWYLEGAAVFMETWMAGGLGRAQGAYDEMVFRSMVRDDAHFYDPLGLSAEGTEVDFRAGANAYLYGTRFMSYLAYQYSPEALIRWWQRVEGSKRNYSDQFQHVFGKPLDQAWQEWVQWEHEFQRSNLAAVRQYPTTPHKDLAPRALGSVSRAFEDPETRKLYVAVRYPGVVGHIASISLDDGSSEQLREVKGPVQLRVTSLAYDQQTKTLFYTDDNEALRDLMSLDLRTGKSTALIENARIGDLVVNPADRSLWGLRSANGRLTVVRLKPPYTKWSRVHTFPFGEVLYDIDISPDGKLLSTSFGRMNGDQFVRVMKIESLLDGDPNPVSQFNFGTAVPESFVFSKDGKYLYGSSYYTGVSNIYRYEIATGKVEAVSNAETGFFRPVPLSDGSMLVFHYTGDGFVPARIQAAPLEDLSAVKFLGAMVAKEHPIVQGWQVASPSSIKLDPMIENEGKYSPVRNLGLESAYPVVEGYKDSIALGVAARFSDPIRFDRLTMSASYSVDDSVPSDERAHVMARYEHRAWSAELSYNKADFYDLFGPTKTSRKGYAAELGYRKFLIYDLPREMVFETELAYYADLDTLPAFQNVAASFDKLATANVELTYKDLRSSLGSVDDETGYEWGLLGHLYQANGDLFPGIFGKFDVGFALPFGHSSIWLRTAAGLSSGDRVNPLANAYFGGFGNNYVDDEEVKRYRDVLRLPGFEIDEVAAQSFGKAMLEWNLPPIRFESAGTRNLYATWARPALFSTVLVADPDDGNLRRTVYDVGAQVDLQIKVQQRLPMVLSFGYAAGFESGGVKDREFMISLKIL